MKLNHFSSVSSAVSFQQKHLVLIFYSSENNLLNQCPLNLKQKTISYTLQLTDQSNQFQSSSNQISESSPDQNTNQPLPQWTNITHTENPLEQSVPPTCFGSYFQKKKIFPFGTFENGRSSHTGRQKIYIKKQ